MGVGMLVGKAVGMDVGRFVGNAMENTADTAVGNNRKVGRDWPGNCTEGTATSRVT